MASEQPSRAYLSALDSGYQLSGEAVAFYRQHPADFVREQMGAEPYPEQVEMLEALARGEWVSWRSGHGPGKSAGISFAMAWFLYCHPNAVIPVTAPKREQLFDVLWAEFARWLRHSLLEPDIVWGKTKIYLRDREESCFAVARTSRTPEAMAGFHSESLLFIVDEASGVQDPVFETLEGALTGQHALVILAGNPTRTQGYFYDSHHGDRARWHTMHTSSEGHPNVRPEYATRIADKWGRESDVYRVRVLGDFPVGDPDTFITLDKAEGAAARDVDPEGPVEIGVDVARYGDDRTVIRARQGLHVFGERSSERDPLHMPAVTLARSSVPEVIGHTLRYAAELRKRRRYSGPIRVKVDDSGVGGGVTDGLQLEAQAAGLEVLACNFGGAGTDEYDDFATVMWARVRDMIGQMELPNEPDMLAELSTRRYKVTPKGKIKIEPKDEYKRRRQFSPDDADALVLCFAEAAGPVPRIRELEW